MFRENIINKQLLNFSEILTEEVSRIFGRGTVQHIKYFCEGRYNYLSRINEKCKLKIINHLEIEDIINLSLVDKCFNKVCFLNLPFIKEKKKLVAVNYFYHASSFLDTLVFLMLLYNNYFNEYSINIKKLKKTAVQL